MILFPDDLDKFLLKFFLKFFIILIRVSFPVACPLQHINLIPNPLPKHRLHLPISEKHLIQSGKIVCFTNAVGESPQKQAQFIFENAFELFPCFLHNCDININSFL